MKQFVIKAYDGEGKLDKRMEVRSTSPMLQPGSARSQHLKER